MFNLNQTLMSWRERLQSSSQDQPLQQKTACSQPWEQLVTEGHVRAARLRMIAPYIIGIGVFAVTAGVYGFIIKPSHTPLPSMSVTLQNRLHEFKAPVIQPFQILSFVPPLTTEQINELPPDRELPKVIELLKASLQESESYPKELVDIIKEVDLSTFWQGRWPVVGIVTISDKKDLRAFGATVMQKTRYGTTAPARWIGIFKHSPKGWMVVSISHQGMAAPSEFPTAKPDDLAVSLKKLMGIQ